MHASVGIVDKIIGVLSPHVGSHMARAALDAHAAKLRLDLQRLTPAELGRLADRIALGLRVFVGPAKAEEAAHAVRRLGPELGAAGSGPAGEGGR